MFFVFVLGFLKQVHDKISEYLNRLGGDKTIYLYIYSKNSPLATSFLPFHDGSSSCSLSEDRASPWQILHLMATYAIGLKLASSVVPHRVPDEGS